MLDATTHAERYDEIRFYAGKQLPVRLYGKSFGMGRLALSSALFGISRGARRTLKCSLETFRGGCIEYQGVELRQDDATVLMALVHARRRGVLSDHISFRPRDFCEAMGWSTCSRGVAHLRECIERMQSSLLRLTTVSGLSGGRFHLVGDFEWGNDEVQLERWTVRLSDTIAALFEGGTTFLPIPERTQLTDGLQTWLASFLRAQSDEHTFSLRDLHRFSGSAGSLREFGKHIRKTMPRLQAVGVVSGYDFGRDRLRVHRA